MKAILLYSDHGLSTSILPNSVCEYFDGNNFSLQHEIRKVTPLSIRIKTAIDQSELIPDEVFDTLIENFVATSKPKTIVFRRRWYCSEAVAGVVRLTENYFCYKKSRFWY